MRTFGDILDFLRNGILRDITDPALWTDEILCECIAQAHDEFAERTLCIRDSTSLAARFTLEAGVDTYALHPTVLSVMSAMVEGEPHNLIRGGSSALDGYVPPPDTVAWLETINHGTAQDGTPQVFVTDDSVAGAGGAATVRVWPTPAAADEGRTVLLRVTRLPLTQCSMSTLEAVPEVPRQFLMGLAHGGAAVAYSLQDSDGADPNRAVDQRALFENHVKNASRNARHKMFAPLAWGFGRAGFSHSR